MATILRSNWRSGPVGRQSGQWQELVLKVPVAGNRPTDPILQCARQIELNFLQMIRRFWIAFNAVAVAALSLLTIAVDWLIMSAFFVPQRSWQEWREWIWLPVMILPPLWLPWIAWRLLRREIARSRVQNEVMAKSSLSSRPPFVSRDWVNTRKIPGLNPIHRFVSWFWHIGGLNDVKRPLSSLHLGLGS
jgi:hypothetical protein